MSTCRFIVIAGLVFLLPFADVRAQLAPQVITQPASQGVVPGSSVLFSVNASGSAPLAYQWRKNSIDIGGASAASYTLNNVTTNDEANYTVRISNASGAVTSQVATLTVYIAPTIVTQPQGRTNAQGSNVTFTVFATGTAPLIYQWKKDGANIPGAYLNGYSINNLQLSDTGTYSVTVGNSAGSVNSASAILQVLVRPSIATAPQTQTVLVGQTATFSVTAAGSEPLTYRWRFNGSTSLPFSQGSVTNNTLIITNCQVFYAGNYTVVVTNAAGSITSSAAALMVNIPPTITGQPVSRTIGAGSNVTFAVSATGPNLSYQWRKDGNPILGAAMPSFSITGVQFTNAGGYSCVVTNPFGAVTSIVATLTVVQIAPSIVTQPQSQSVAVGGTAAFSVTAGGTTLAYDWRKDGQSIPGANASSYTLTNVSLADAGGFTVLITNPIGSITSTVATLTVGYPPVFTTHPVAQTNSVGGAANFSGLVTGTAPISLQWHRDGVPLLGQTNATLTFTNLQPLQIGYYHLSAVNPFGFATSSNAPLSLIGFDFFDFTGLVAFYPFNGNANDESGHGNNGIVNGATLSADRFGNPGSAYDFGGTNNIEIVDNAAFGSQSFTVSMWFNVSQFPGSGVFTEAEFLISKGQNNFELHLGSPGVSGPTGIRFLPRFGSGANWDTPPSAYTTNRWHQIVAAYDPPSGYIAVYVDGRSLPLIGPSSLPATADNSLNAWIGMRNFGTGPSFGTPTKIDEVRIYNRALTSNEIAQLYSREADLPVISQQPQSQTLAAGDIVTFSVVASASRPLTYQWSKDGLPIANATNSTLVVSNVQARQIGNYSVEVNNGVGTVRSSRAALSLTGYNFVEWAGLVARYPFNGNADDETGSGANCSTSNIQFTSDRFGNVASAIQLNGSSSQIIQAQQSFNIGWPEYTVAGWFKSDDVSKTDQTIFNTMPHTGFSFVLNHGAHREVASCIVGNGVAWVSPHNNGLKKDYQTGVWYHGVFLKKETLYVSFINGVRDQSMIVPSAVSFNLMCSLRFGSISNTPSPSREVFQGALDDIRIYSRALTDAEVQELFTRDAVGDTLTASAQWTPAGLTLRFPAAPNVSYSILFATNLPAASWQKWLDVPAATTNRVAEFLDSSATNQSQRYYRVVAPPQ